MRVLDLFSGIGGFSLGLERAGMTTVGFCEVDPFCRRVLAKHWPHVPIFDDVRELTGERIRSECGTVDVISGGFPCQPWSLAGKRRGREDDRDLWPEMRRLIAEVGPRWVIGENVPGLDDGEYMALDGVLSDLEGIGYESQAFEIPACAVDAPHRRSRLWIVAHADRAGREELRGTVSAPAQHEAPEYGGPLSDARRRRGEGKGSSLLGEPFAARWLAEPDVGRVAHGIPRRVDRLRALGNAVVPQVVEMIGRAILEAA